MVLAQEQMTVTVIYMNKYGLKLDGGLCERSAVLGQQQLDGIREVKSN